MRIRSQRELNELRREIACNANISRQTFGETKAVTTPLLDLEVAAVGVDRAVGLLVEGDVVGLDSYRPR
jgi:hypothetical protein